MTDRSQKMLSETRRHGPASTPDALPRRDAPGRFDDSALVTAQRQAIETAFGPAVQRRASASGAPPLQAYGLPEIMQLASGMGLGGMALTACIAAVGLYGLYQLLLHCTSKEEVLAAVEQSRQPAGSRPPPQGAPPRVTAHGNRERGARQEDHRAVRRTTARTADAVPEAHSTADAVPEAHRTALRHVPEVTPVASSSRGREDAMEADDQPRLAAASSSSSSSGRVRRTTEALPTGKVKRRGVADPSYASGPSSAAAAAAVAVAPPAGYTLFSSSYGNQAAYLNIPAGLAPSRVALDHLIEAADGQGEKTHRSTSMSGTLQATYVHPSDHELYTFSLELRHTDGLPTLTVHEIGKVRGDDHKFKKP